MPKQLSEGQSMKTEFVIVAKDDNFKLSREETAQF